MKLKREIIICISGFTIAHLIYHGVCKLIGYTSSLSLFGDYFWGMIVGGCIALFIFRKT